MIIRYLGPFRSGLRVSSSGPFRALLDGVFFSAGLGFRVRRFWGLGFRVWGEWEEVLV